jgi:hypothetical protein
VKGGVKEGEGGGKGGERRKGRKRKKKKEEGRVNGGRWWVWGKGMRDIVRVSGRM